MIKLAPLVGLLRDRERWALSCSLKIARGPGQMDPDRISGTTTACIDPKTKCSAHDGLVYIIVSLILD